MKTHRPIVSNENYELVKRDFDTFDEGLNHLIYLNECKQNHNKSLSCGLDSALAENSRFNQENTRLNSYVLTQGVVNVALAAVITAMVFLVY